MKRTTTLATVLVAVLGLLLAACGQGTDVGEASSDTLGSSVDGGAETDGNDVQDDAGGDEAGTDGDDAGDDGNAMDDDGDGTGDGDDGADQADAGAGTLRSSVLGAALDTTSAMSSARFEGTIEITGTPGSELPGTVTMAFSGAFDEPNQASEVTVDFGALMAAAMEADPEAAAGMELFGEFLQDPIQMITIGDTSWIKWGLLAIFGVEDKWLEAPAEEGGGFTSEMGFGGESPTDLLESLADADADLAEVGREEIRGVETTHYRADVDVEALAASMSAAERAEFEAGLGTPTEGVYVIDLWIDDGGLLHRFVLDAAELPETADNDVSNMKVSYDIWDHGVDLNISPPPADQIVTEAELGFSLEDFGDLGG